MSRLQKSMNLLVDLGIFQLFFFYKNYVHTVVLIGSKTNVRHFHIIQSVSEIFLGEKSKEK